MARLRALDLRADGCLQFGASTDIIGAKKRDLARDLGEAIYDGRPLDGILYRS